MKTLLKVSSYILAGFLACVTLLPAQRNIPFTSIQDTLNNPDGTPFSGTVYITWPTYQVGNSTVAAGKQSVLVTNGALTVSLTPTDQMSPQGTFYTISYVTDAGNPVSTFWSVPTSSGPVTLSKIQPIAPSGVGGGGGGLAAPGAAGLMKYTGANTTAPATPNDVLNLFNGPQNSTTYVAGDGTLKSFPAVPTIPASGVVKSSGTALSPAVSSDILGLFSGLQNPTTYAAGDGTLKPFPVIPTVPTTVSSFVNDAKYIPSGANAMFAGVLSAIPGTSVTNIVVIGDSTNACSQPTCGVGPSTPTNLAGTVLARNLSSNNAYRHGTGMTPIISGSGLREGWTLTGGAITNVVNFGPYQTGSNAGYGAYGTTLVLSGAGNYVEFTGNGDSVTIYGATYTDSGSGCTVTIDGASQPAFQPGTSLSYTAVKQTYSSLNPYAPHVIHLAGPATGNCYVFGGEYTVGTQGLSMHIYARGGAATWAFGGDTANQLAYLGQISGGIQMAIIDVGINDLSANMPTTPSTYSTQIQNIITYLRSITSSVPILLVNPWLVALSPPSTTLTASNIKTVLTSLVASNANVSLLDMTGYWASSPVAQVNGLLVDGTHASDFGAQDFANKIASQITGAARFTAVSSMSGAAVGDWSVTGLTFPHQSHDWKVGAITGDGVFSFKDNTTTLVPFSFKANSGSGLNAAYNLNMGANTLLSWGDTWFGRASTGLLFIGSTGNSGQLVTRPVASVPTSSTSQNCTQGQVNASAATGYIYFCDSTNHWIRAAAASF